MMTAVLGLRIFLSALLLFVVATICESVFVPSKEPSKGWIVTTICCAVTLPIALTMMIWGHWR